MTELNDTKTELTAELNEPKAVRFLKCIGCPDMGMSCLGANLLMLPIGELKKWVNAWRAHYKLSIEACADIWKIGDSSAKRFVNPQEKDIRYTTVQCIIRGIVGYGFPPDKDFGDWPCPGTSAEFTSRITELEIQLEKKRDECEYLLEKKNASAHEYIERMAEARENFKEQLEYKEDTIQYLKELADKRQRDLEKSEAVARDYLNRIDVKNQQLLDAYAEIRKLHGEILKISNANIDDLRSMVDRFLRLSEAHEMEVEALMQKIKTAPVL